VNVSYATNDGTTLSQAVSVLTANGTYDAMLTSSGLWAPYGGLHFTASDAAEIPSFTFPSVFTLTALVNSTITGFETLVSLGNQNAGGTFFFWLYENGDQLQLQYAQPASYGVLNWGGYITGYAGQFVNLTLVINYVTGVVSFYFKGMFTFNQTMTTPVVPSGSGRLEFNEYLSHLLAGGVSYKGINITSLSQSYYWLMNESSGSVVYGYDDNTALTTTPTARLISQTAGGVNSSIIDTTGFPVSNATDKYTAAAGFFDRVNTTTAQVLNLIHSVYDTFGVSHSETGTVNATNGWMTAGSPFSILATPYIGQYFQYWQRDGVIEGAGNPGIVAATGAHAYVAVFGPTPYVTPPYPLVISSFPLTWMLFGVWLALMFLFQRHELKFLAGIFGVMLGWQTFAGEYWLTLTSLGATATVRYSTIFSIPMALFEVAFSTIVMFNVMWALMHAKPAEKRPR
jgi:hypothetical protein